MYLEEKRGWMVIRLVIDLREHTAKYYVIFGEPPPPLKPALGATWVQ